MTWRPDIAGQTSGAFGASNQTIPARLDRLPWSRWHWRVVVALGVAWILDGLEVTLVGSLGAVLSRGDTLALSARSIGLAGSLYIAGAVSGALIFGSLTDRLGRKKLFLVTLAVYMAATLATAFSPGFLWFAACRFLTGLGIGGEYAAINSAIDELIPARVRGRVNLAINGSFWLGAALGAGLALVVLDPRVLGPARGWRACFLLGAVLAAAILVIRRHVPESPRWLLSAGRAAEAERVVAAIETEIHGHPNVLPRAAVTSAAPDAPAGDPGGVGQSPGPNLLEAARLLVFDYRQRTLVALALMIAQAFFYNAIFFTYALVLGRFYAVPADRVSLYLFPFALGNVLGPFVLGPLFDRLGRRHMIAATYILSGLGLALTAWAFDRGWLDARSQALCWSAVFFIASAAASSAYLTVSEIFPLQMRAQAIAIFYALGTGVGGVAAPLVLGALIQTGERGPVALGWGFGAGLVVAAGLVQLLFGVDAEGRALEEVAPPLRFGAARLPS